MTLPSISPATGDSQELGRPPAGPLQLHQISVRGFRSLRAVGPVAIQPGLTMLTGENDGGKSSFLDAVAFLLGGYTGDDADCSRDEASPDEAEITVEGLFYALDDPARATPVWVRAQRRRGASRQVAWRDRRHARLEDQPQRLTVAALKPLAASLGLAVPSSARKEELVTAIEGWLAARPDTEFVDHWRPLSREEEQRLPRYTRFSSAAAQDPKQTVLNLVQREARALLSGPPYTDRLATINATIEAELAPQLQAMRDRMRDYCPDLGDISIAAHLDFSRPTITITMQMSHNGAAVEVSVDKVGEGRRRRLTLALHEASLASLAATTPQTTEILAYDEPDTHLDYSSQHRLFDILKVQAAYPHLQVLVATHSINFIDRVPLEGLRHFRLSAERTTRVAVLTGDGPADEGAFLASICESLGLRNSVLLDERVFLIVEGETETNAIPGLFRLVTGRRLTEAGIMLINATGIGAVRPLLDFLVKTGRKRVISLIDSDARDDQTRRLNASYLAELGLTEASELHFIGEREFEDAFSDDLWCRLLQDRFPPPPDEPAWSAAEIAALRAERKFSEALVSRVSSRHRQYVTKPLLGAALASLCQLPDLPPALIHCFAVAQQQANPLSHGSERGGC